MNKSQEIDFFSELSFDFVRSVLFNQYLDYRLPELSLISTVFRRIITGKMINEFVYGTENATDVKESLNNLLRKETKEFLEVAPILEEIIESEFQKDHGFINSFISRSSEMYTKLYSKLNHKCLCSDCKDIGSSYTLHRIAIDTGLEINPYTEKSKIQIRCLIRNTKGDEWIPILKKIYCPYLLVLSGYKEPYFYQKITMAALSIGDLNLFKLLNAGRLSSRENIDESVNLKYETFIKDLFGSNTVMNTGIWFSKNQALQLFIDITKILRKYCSVDDQIYSRLESIFMDNVDNYMPHIKFMSFYLFPLYDIDLIMTLDAKRIFHAVLPFRQDYPIPDNHIVKKTECWKIYMSYLETNQK